MKIKKNNVKKSSIIYKISAISFIVSIISVSLALIILMTLYNREIMKRSRLQISESINVMSDRADSVLNEALISLNNLTLEINNIERNKGLQTRKSQDIRNTLVKNSQLFKGINSTVYITKNEMVYFSNDKMRVRRESILNSGLYKELKKTKSVKELMYIDDEGIMNLDGDKNIVFGRRVNSIVNGETLGYIFVNMDRDYLIRAYDSEIGEYFLFDKEYNYLTTREASKENSKDEEVIIENLMMEDDAFREKILSMKSGETIDTEFGTYLVEIKSFASGEWTMVGLTNVNRFNVTKGQLLLVLIVVASVVLGLTGMMQLITKKYVTDPIAKLRDGALKIAEGDLSVRFSPKGNNEISDFSNTFNYMTEQNQLLVKRINEESKKKREYELALIQEQVKPHFLYNTLDIIIMLIEMKRAREAERVTRKLAEYYKNSLLGAEEIVSIAREKQIIIDYLDLQLMRYGEKFKYEVDIPEEFDSVRIPKMTLQPLVENAIYHGIKLREGWGSIRISGYALDDGSVMIVLSDNGIGMNEEQLTKLKNQMTRNPEEIDSIEMSELNDKKHFGVYSVYNRLRLYYGEDYGLNIESSYGVGTRVLIHLPYDYKPEE